MFKFKGLLTAFFVVISTTFSYAQNVGFETGNFTDWTTGATPGTWNSNNFNGNGNAVKIVSGNQTYNSNSHGAMGTPGTTYYAPAVTPHTWVIGPYGSYMAAIQPSGNYTFAQMSSGLGLSASSQSALTSMLHTQAQASGFGSGNVTNTSWMSRDVSMTSGQTVTMAWNYVSTDYVPFNDGSIATMVNTADGTVLGTVNNKNAQYTLLGFTNPGTGDYSTNSFGFTGWQQITYVATTPGTYRLGFGIFNLDDTALSPILFVDSQEGTMTQDGNTFGPIAPNAGSGAPDNSGGGSGSGSSPTVVSTAAGSDIVTTSTTYGTSTSTASNTFGKTSNGKNITIDKAEVTNTSTPVTVTTVTTPTTVTTYSDGSTTTTNGTPVTTTSTSTALTSTTVCCETKTAYIGGASDAYNNAIVKPFIVDPSALADGSWADVTMNSANNIGGTNVNFGYQKTLGDFTAGVAGSAGKIASSGLNNSSVTGETYAATAYVLNKSSLVTTKGSIGFGINNYTVDNSIASFGLTNQTKSQQNITYGDLAFYSIKDYAGWTPFAGATVLNSDVGKIEETGSSLLSGSTVVSNKTYTMPYVGVKNEVSPGVVVEVKATQTEPYGTIVSGKVTAKNKIANNTSLNVTIGADKGQNYDSLSVMLGLVVNF
jgi:hypothetical protein